MVTHVSIIMHVSKVIRFVAGLSRAKLALDVNRHPSNVMEICRCYICIIMHYYALYYNICIIIYALLCIGIQSLILYSL